MVKVAVAGTGGVARHVIDAIFATKKHEIIVLSRSPNAALESQGITVIQISYTDPSSLEAALKGVHTVISTIADFSGAESWATPQLALLRAAKNAGVKRFAPSEFGGNSFPDDISHPLKGLGWKLEVRNAVRESGLEYTMFQTGLFMNYMASSTPGMGYLRPLSGPGIVDVEHCSALIAGDGTVQTVLTRVEDIAAFVAASLDLPEWPEISRMTGELVSYNEVVAVAETVRGKHPAIARGHLTERLTGKKFDVTYISEEELEKRIDWNASDLFTNVWYMLRLDGLRKKRFFWTDANLNKLCPEVNPMGVEAFLRTWWGTARD